MLNLYCNTLTKLIVYSLDSCKAPFYTAANSSKRVQQILYALENSNFVTMIEFNLKKNRLETKKRTRFSVVL